VKLLLAHGASPNCRDIEDNSVIAMAVLHWTQVEHKRVLFDLIDVFVHEGGVDINHKNKCGWTAYDVAASAETKDILTRFGATSGRMIDSSSLFVGNIEQQRSESQPWLQRQRK
jgi:hypothetical protein